MRMPKFVPRSVATMCLLAALPAEGLLSQAVARATSGDRFSLLDWQPATTGRGDVFRAALRAAHRNASAPGSARYFGEIDLDANQPTPFQGVAGIQYWAEAARANQHATDRFTPDAPLTTTPEPASMVLLATGLVILAVGAILRRPPFNSRTWDP